MDEIREIRASERRFYQKITDIYATAMDYSVDASITQTFFKTVQNKLHFAIHGKAAAELIIERANAENENMGMTTWKSAPSGKIAKAFAESEFEKYRVIQDRLFESDFDKFAKRLIKEK